MRSRKLASLLKSLNPPKVQGDDEGDLLIVGWGSTYGAISEAVQRAQAEGLSVSCVHLRFLSPMEPGLKEIFSRFRRVMTVEINYSDPDEVPVPSPEHRRHAQLAQLLREHTLVEIDSWSNVHGQPMQPGSIFEEIVRRFAPSQRTAAKGDASHVRPQV